MLDVVIPHLNAPYLLWCIESLRRLTPSGVLASVVVVDQSREQKALDGVDYHVLCKDQVGFARAVNVGMGMGRAPYVMVLNDDCEFLDSRWWYGILKTFETHADLLCVNPSSPNNPGAENKFKEPKEVTSREYSRLLSGQIADGICMWAPVFSREQLNKVQGSRQGLWFDERFWPGGGEDYDMGRRAALSGLRCVGTNMSWVWHWWHATEVGGEKTAKYDGGTFERKWSDDNCDRPDLFGSTGTRHVPKNKTLEGGW